MVGLKEYRRRPGAPATGLVALQIRTTHEHGEPVLDFWRRPMIPLRDADAETGHAHDFAAIPQALDTAKIIAAVPSRWRLDRLRAAVPRPHHGEFAPGQAFVVEAGDTVTGAPELARLTLNIATAPTDATGSAPGRRPVYGGHTISVAAAHATRAIPRPHDRGLARLRASRTGVRRRRPAYRAAGAARWTARADRPTRAGQRLAPRRGVRSGARLELRGGGRAVVVR